MRILTHFGVVLLSTSCPEDVFSETVGDLPLEEEPDWLL
jgi:hypothetical protein